MGFLIGEYGENVSMGFTLNRGSRRTREQGVVGRHRPFLKPPLVQMVDVGLVLGIVHAIRVPSDARLRVHFGWVLLRVQRRAGRRAGQQGYPELVVRIGGGRERLHLDGLHHRGGRRRRLAGCDADG